MLSWILPIASFKIMENRKPVLMRPESVPIALLMCVERVVLIVGVAVLKWRWLALDVAIIIVETKTHSRWARSWLLQYGLAKWRYYTGFEMFEIFERFERFHGDQRFKRFERFEVGDVVDNCNHMTAVQEIVSGVAVSPQPRPFYGFVEPSWVHFPQLIEVINSVCKVSHLKPTTSGF